VVIYGSAIWDPVGAVGQASPGRSLLLGLVVISIDTILVQHRRETWWWRGL